MFEELEKNIIKLVMNSVIEFVKKDLTESLAKNLQYKWLEKLNKFNK